MPSSTNPTRISVASRRRSSNAVGGIGAVLLHVGVIAATLFTWSHKLEITDQAPPVVPVELVTIAAKTNITPMVREKPKEEPPKDDVQPPAPEPVKAPEPAPQQTAEAPPPKSAPAPEVVKPAPPPPEPAPEPEIVKKITPPKAVPKVKTPPKAKPVPETKAVTETETDEPKPQTKKTAAKADEKDKFDINNIVALLDKQAPSSAASPKAKVGNRTIKGFGEQNAMTMDLVDSLRNQIAQCWSPPVGSPHPEQLIVTFELYLNADGTVAQPPQLAGSSAGGDSYMRAAVEAARRAIYTCQPYKMPSDRFGQWHDITLNFDPRQMVGQ